MTTCAASLDTVCWAASCGAGAGTGRLPSLGYQPLHRRQRPKAPARFRCAATRTDRSEKPPRPGLDRRARSIVVLSVCVANGQWDEFRLHLRGALNNGLTQDEIKEILIQCAVYASVPAANHAFKEAAAFFKEAGV